MVIRYAFPRRSVGTREKSLQNWVAAFKRYTARIIKMSFGINPLWQKNFYDHIVRKEESMLKIAEYIVNNPVRKGIVSHWHEYSYSKMVYPLLKTYIAKYFDSIDYDILLNLVEKKVKDKKALPIITCKPPQSVVCIYVNRRWR